MCRPIECRFAVELRQARVDLEDLLQQVDDRDCRIEELEHELEHTKAILRSRENLLFGKKSEKSKAKSEETSTKSTRSQAGSDDSEDQGRAEEKRGRGAQAGHEGHGRKIPEDLPVEEEIHEVPPDDAVCPKCGKPLSKSGLFEESHEITMEVRFVLVKHKRERMFRECDCSGVPVSVTAPLPPKIIPKGLFSHPFLAHVLTYKYGFQLPLARIALMFAMAGLQVNPGTLCNIFKKLQQILFPLYVLFREMLGQEERLHVDETSFRCFGFTQVEVAPRKHAWLWVFRGENTVFFVVDPSRSSSVLEDTLGSNMDATLISDHYCVYKKYARETADIEHALCWGHFRRFFKDAAVSYESLADWCDLWIERIGQIYHLNTLRLKAVGDEEKFAAAQKDLEKGVEEFHAAIEDELRSSDLHEKQFKILTSALGHWDGYTVFVKDHRIPMDNNAAERALRPGALGRKNWYGVHADWSGTFAAMMMTFIQTAIEHGLNPIAYIHYILDRFAGFEDHPQNLQELLPWNIPEDVREDYKMNRSNSP